jgi:membrane protease YdiL (CAAX protease family)
VTEAEAAVEPRPRAARALYALLPQLIFWIVGGLAFGLLAAFDADPDTGDMFFSPANAVVILASYVVLLAATVVVARRWFGEPREVLRLRRTPFWPAVGWGALTFVVSIVASLVLESIFHGAEDQGLTPNAFPGGAEATIGLALTAVGICLFGPVVEELYFRGLLYHSLRRWGVPVAITGSSILFSLVHGVPRAIPVLFVLGALFALLAEKTDSIIPAAVLHALNNSLAMVAALAADE